VGLDRDLTPLDRLSCSSRQFAGLDRKPSAYWRLLPDIRTRCWRGRGLGAAIVGRALQVLRAVGAGRYGGELCGPRRVQARVLLRHQVDDIKFRPPLLHQHACRFTGFDGAWPTVDSDAGPVERIEKARIEVLIGGARVGMHSRGHAQCGGHPQQHQETTHRTIMAHVGGIVVPAPKPRNAT
jgi:hypothetical protein